jgi:uncharacterized protein YciI
MFSVRMEQLHSKRPTLNVQRPMRDSEGGSAPNALGGDVKFDSALPTCLASSKGPNNVTALKMKNFYLRFFIPLVCIAVQSLAAQTPDAAAKPKQFIYVLHLVPRLHDDKAWTEQDKAAVDRHLNHFKEAIQSGQLILAGRTRETGDKTFGIAIFEAADETAARKFMDADPAVVAGVMTAELHAFAVVLQRKNP